MSSVTKVTCDQCNEDITYTWNSVGYRVALINERLPINPAAHAVTDMMKYAPVAGGNKHFCDMQCLKKWIAK